MFVVLNIQLKIGFLVFQMNSDIIIEAEDQIWSFGGTNTIARDDDFVHQCCEKFDMIMQLQSHKIVTIDFIFDADSQYKSVKGVQIFRSQSLNIQFIRTFLEHDLGLFFFR